MDVLSLQLYTLRELGDVDKVLDTAAAAGYRHVEMIGSHLNDAASVKAKLDARGLQGSSSHVGLGQLRDKPEAIIAACETLGISDLFMPAVPPEDREMDAAGWRAVGKELGEIAETFEKSGIRLGYHNHHWELTPKEGGTTALELLFEGAGSSPLTWQADVAWLVRGGADPEIWLERYKDRLRSAHVKDIAPEGQGLDEDGWADVGSGTLDWHRLWQSCRKRGAYWMVVEHDKPADPTATVANSFAYLSTLEF
jgi:sugar phosphate isomerase/epimerase